MASGGMETNAVETMPPRPPQAPAPTPPPPIDYRAAFMATQIVEGHYEAATGSHMHWYYRELSKLLHREFALCAREEAAARSSGQTRRKRRRRDGDGRDDE